MPRMLAPGEPAPWFRASELGSRSSYTFSSGGGRWIVMLFPGSAADAAAERAFRLVRANHDAFDGVRAAFFGIVTGAEAIGAERLDPAPPRIHWLLDPDSRIAALYGATGEDGEAPHWLLIDPMMRVRARVRIGDGKAILDELRRRLSQPAEVSTAPVLVVPAVLPPELCRHLIGLYEKNGGIDSGVMRDENGTTVRHIDHTFKRRADYLIEDLKLQAALKQRVHHVLRPMIQRFFQFDVTRIERFIVACYDGESGGHFGPHRDNTTIGTAHRRFACTINLNTGAYEGGELCFPEFGPRGYSAPAGGAVVFSCGMLHQALPVTRGRRYAFLPFFYDDEGARLRERNAALLGPELSGYRSGLSGEPKAG